MINLLAQAIYDGIYIIDCASLVLSVLPIIMNVAEDRCVSLCLEAWLFFAFVGGPGASGGAVVLRSGADTARSPHQLRDASSPARRARLTAASVGFTTFRACTFFWDWPAIAGTEPLRSHRHVQHGNGASHNATRCASAADYCRHYACNQ